MSYSKLWTILVSTNVVSTFLNFWVDYCFWLFHMLFSISPVMDHTLLIIKESM